MGQSETADLEVGEKGLHIAKNGFAGGRVSDMADRGIALQPLDHLLRGEMIGDMPEFAMRIEAMPVEGDDAGRFLAAMLQGMEPQNRVSGRFFDAVDPEDAALFLEMIIVPGMGGDQGQITRSLVNACGPDWRSGSHRASPPQGWVFSS